MGPTNLYLPRILPHHQVFYKSITFYSEHFEELLNRGFKTLDIATFVRVYMKVQEFEEDLYKKFTYEQTSQV